MATDSLYINDARAQMTPVAPMSFIYLGKADRFKNPDGTLAAPKYSVRLKLDSRDASHLAYMTYLNSLNDAVGAELLEAVAPKDKKRFTIKDICKAEEDDDGNTTGFFFLKATSNKPPKSIKDSVGNDMLPSVAATAWDGSTGRIIMSLKKSTDTIRKTVGLVLYLEKAQIVTLVQGGGASGGGDFGSVAGGFVSTPVDDSDVPNF